MNKNFLSKVQILIIFSSIIVSFAGCKSKTEKATEYYFENIDDIESIYHTSKIKDIIADFSRGYSQQCVIVQGRILNLFGNPLYETKDIENQYCYAIKATDLKGNEYLLSVYSGASGPAIGGDIHAEGIEAAADALIEAIMSASPIDFTYEGYWPDGPTELSFGIEDGKVYYNEVPIIDLDKREAMYKELGYK